MRKAPVVSSPVDEVIDHQSLAHEVLSSRVVAARRVAVVAEFRAAVIVAGNDAIEDAVLVEARGKGVVVHDVHHDAQAHAVQPLRDRKMKISDPETIEKV